MIIQALTQYYDRLSSDPGYDIAPLGWAKVPIPFVVVIDSSGELIQIEDTRQQQDTKLRAKNFLVPQPIKKTSGIAANLLWENAGYVFGVPKKEKDGTISEKNLLRAMEQKEAFIGTIETMVQDSPKRSACLKFLREVTDDQLSKFPVWEYIKDDNSNISIRFVDDLHLYCQDNDVKSVYPSKEKAELSRCMISGALDTPARLHNSIKGVFDANTSGANIVSFNLRPFESYGKKQGENAPIGNLTMFKYTTALSELLSSDSQQKIQVGNTTMVFWSDKKTSFETLFFQVFGEPPRDDPHENTQYVKSLINSPYTGELLDNEPDTSFFVLGLSPNKARISIRFWITGKIKDFSSHIKRHFEDLSIIKHHNEPLFYTIHQLLIQTAPQGDYKKIPPNLAGDLVLAILQGTPYPLSVYQQILQRIRSDGKYRMNAQRASLIKAYLNRKIRFFPNSQEKELHMALDVDQPSTGYQLGRLMATLEKIQSEANPGINATVADRYYGSACSTPVTVFSTLLRLMRHHLSKMDNPGRRIMFEKLIGEILGHISEFPAHLNMNEQGKFAVGYYHQKQDFYTKKESV